MTRPRLAGSAKIPLEFDQNPAEQQSAISGPVAPDYEQITQRWKMPAHEAPARTPRLLAKRACGEAVKLFRLARA